MKVCPKCNAHYQDDVFFCLNDGTPLETTEAVRPQQPQRSEEPTVAFPSRATVIKSEQLPPAGVVSEGSNRRFLLAAGLLGILMIFLGSAIGVGIWYFQRDGTDGTGGAENTGNARSNENTGSNETGNAKETPTAEEKTPTPEPTAETTPTPEPTPITEPTPTPEPETEPEGRISGGLTYPGEGIPTNLHICVEETKKGATVCSNSPKDGFSFKVNRASASYSVSLPAGTYHIYATVPGQARAYYTEFISCGMSVDCRSHRKIAVRVRGGKTTGGIMVGDWYDF